MYIFDYLLEEIMNGKLIRCDLNKGMIKGTEVDRSKFDGWIDLNRSNVNVSMIESAYERYYYSLPGEKDDSRFFYALPADELTDEQMVTSMRRQEAKMILECLVFCVCREVKPWFEGWFWRSDQNKNLVILRDWFVNA